MGQDRLMTRSRGYILKQLYDLGSPFYTWLVVSKTIYAHGAREGSYMSD